VPGGKGFWWANKVVGAGLGAQPFVPPSVLYVALYLVLPTPAGGGVEVSEPSYIRAAVPNDPAHWEAPIGGVTSNLQPIVFPDATGDWGLVIGFAIFDALAGGDALYFAPFNSEYVILRGSKSRFPVGSLVVVEK